MLSISANYVIESVYNGLLTFMNCHALTEAYVILFYGVMSLFSIVTK